MSKRKLMAAVAVVAAAAMAFTGCTPTPQSTSGLNQQSTATVAWNQAFYSFNNATTFGNATANANIIYMTNEAFAYYDKDLKLVPNTSFGTYEKVSDDPLTIKMTLADTATWSDGTPVTPADMVLAWAAQSGNFNNYEAKIDDETGNVTKPNSGSNVYFNSMSAGLGLIKEFPVIEGKSVTFKFSKPFVDWEPNLTLNPTPGLPAHIIGKRALGESDPAKAAEAVLNAFKDKDNAKLAKISNVWNNDFNFKTMPEDKELLVGNGPYTITDLKSEQYVTLTKNPNYKGSHVPSIDTITVRIIPEAQASVQALQNGEVLVTQPQATADILKQLQAVQNVTTLSSEGGTFEHVDLVFDNGGPFDPKSYGGDAEKAKKVRQAFLLTVPRQKIIDTIIKPLNDKATIRNSFTVVPGSANYGPVTKANGMEAFLGGGDQTDKAVALLKEAGVDKPTVRMMYDNTNPRRVQEFQLIKEAAEKAGFKIEDKGNVDWGSLLTKTSGYDASLFGWQSVSLAVGESDANYRTKGNNNFGHYSNPDVDKLLDELLTATEPTRQAEILAQIETHLVNDAFGLSIFQFPEITGVSNKIQNVSSISLSPTMFWNFWEWKLA